MCRPTGRGWRMPADALPLAPPPPHVAPSGSRPTTQNRCILPKGAAAVTNAAFLPDSAELVETILAEGPIGMAAAAKLLGSLNGKLTHPATISRWAGRGVRVADGSRCRLE